MKTRKSWRAKMEDPNLPKIVVIPPRMNKRFGEGTMLVPSPNEIEAFMKTIPTGSLATVSQMRQFLAGKHAASVTCPLTTGIFIRIAAEAAEEDAAKGITGTAPWWRIVKDDGSLNPKLPGGVERQVERLREEGHRIIPGTANKPPRVAMIA